MGLPFLSFSVTMMMTDSYMTTIDDNHAPKITTETKLVLFMVSIITGFKKHSSLLGLIRLLARKKTPIFGLRASYFRSTSASQEGLKTEIQLAEYTTVTLSTQKSIKGKTGKPKRKYQTRHCS
jgi:hypothetical protein